jgi:hypothetical protein
MIKRVKNRERPTRTVLGGVCPVPNACLRIDKTIIILINEVIISSNDGSNVRVVINANNCNDKLY